MDVLFRSYLADGTSHAECSRFSSLDLGASPADNIAAGHTAWVTGDAGNSPRALGELQVSARIRDVLPRPQAVRVDYEVTEQRFLPGPNTSDAMMTGYAPFALLQSTRDDADILATVLFHVYDDRGVHVGSCELDLVVIEPGISHRVACSYPITIDVVGVQPVGVEAVPIPCDIPPRSGPVLSGLDVAASCS